MEWFLLRGTRGAVASRRNFQFRLKSHWALISEQEESSPLLACLRPASFAHETAQNDTTSASDKPRAKNSPPRALLRQESAAAVSSFRNKSAIPRQMVFGGGGQRKPRSQEIFFPSHPLAPKSLRNGQHERIRFGGLITVRHRNFVTRRFAPRRFNNSCIAITNARRWIAIVEFTNTSNRTLERCAK